MIRAFLPLLPVQKQFFSNTKLVRRHHQVKGRGYKESVGDFGLARLTLLVFGAVGMDCASLPVTLHS